MYQTCNLIHYVYEEVQNLLSLQQSVPLCAFHPAKYWVMLPIILSFSLAPCPLEDPTIFLLLPEPSRPSFLIWSCQPPMAVEKCPFAGYHLNFTVTFYNNNRFNFL